MKKSFPKIRSDKHAEELLESDMSEFLSKKNFKKVSFEFLPKDKKVNLRFSDSLLVAIKKEAKKLSIPYQKFIRQILEREVL